MTYTLPNGNFVIIHGKSYTQATTTLDIEVVQKDGHWKHREFKTILNSMYDGNEKEFILDDYG